MSLKFKDQRFKKSIIKDRNYYYFFIKSELTLNL